MTYHETHGTVAVPSLNKQPPTTNVSALARGVGGMLQSISVPPNHHKMGRKLKQSNVEGKLSISIPGFLEGNLHAYLTQKHFHYLKWLLFFFYLWASS